MPRRRWCSPIRPWRWWPCCRPWAGAARRWSAARHIERLAGDFLLPDAARLAQIRLCEIGATHRTLAADYRAACGADTALILHSQPAEFAMTGSVAQAGLDELVALAAGRQIPLVASLPSASLLPLSFTGASRLPLVGQSIVAGADLVLFRGDTCLGGPRVAIVAGRRALIERIAADPLAPIFAADSLSLTALAATLRLCASPQTAVRSIPLVQLLAASSDNLKHRAERLAPQIRHSALVTRVEVLPGEGWLSEARLPDERLPSWCLRIEARGTSAARLAGDLAERTPALWAQADDNYLTLNLRSVLPRQDEQIVTAFAGTGPRARRIPRRRCRRVMCLNHRRPLQRRVAPLPTGWLPPAVCSLPHVPCCPVVALRAFSALCLTLPSAFILLPFSAFCLFSSFILLPSSFCLPPPPSALLLLSLG